MCNDSILSDIAIRLKKYKNIEKALLFGSRARGDNGERSDYDIAVFGDLTFEEMGRLNYELNEELPTLHKIDVVYVNSLSNADLLKNILTEGVEFYVVDRNET